MNMIEFEELRNRCDQTEENSFLERLCNIDSTLITILDKHIYPDYNGTLLNNILNIEKENN